MKTPRIFRSRFRKQLEIHLRKELFKNKVAFHAAQGDLQQANLRGQITVIKQLIEKFV